jgi:hypothetical protein
MSVEKTRTRRVFFLAGNFSSAVDATREAWAAASTLAEASVAERVCTRVVGWVLAEVAELGGTPAGELAAVEVAELDGIPAGASVGVAAEALAGTQAAALVLVAAEAPGGTPVVVVAGAGELVEADIVAGMACYPVERDETQVDSVCCRVEPGGFQVEQALLAGPADGCLAQWDEIPVGSA